MSNRRAAVGLSAALLVLFLLLWLPGAAWLIAAGVRPFTTALFCGVPLLAAVGGFALVVLWSRR